MELKTYDKARQLVDLIGALQSLREGLSISRDFDKVEMKIVFREHGQEATRSYNVPPRVANEICTHIRQDLNMFEANLKDLFYNL